MPVKPLGYSPSGDVDNVDLDALATAVGNAAGNAATALAAANEALDSFPQTDDRTVDSLADYNANNAVFNLLDYSAGLAINNGVIDATTAVQLWLDAIDAAGGGVGYVPQGTYLVSAASLVATTPIHFRGAGRFKSIFKHKASSLNNMLSFTGPVSFEEIGFDGNAANQTTRKAALHLTATASSKVVRHCYFTDTANFAIQLHGVDKTVDILFNDFLDLSEWPDTGSTDDQSVAIGLLDVGTPSEEGKIRVSGNNFINPQPSQQDHGPAGIQVSPADADSPATIEVTNNYFEYFGANRDATQPSAPIDIYAFFKRLVITGNRIYKSGCGGIKCGQPDNGVIANNVLTDSANLTVVAAIFVSADGRDPATPAHNMIVANNVVKTWNGFAYHFVGAASVASNRYILSGNVADGALVGAYLDFAGDMVLEGNIFANSTGTGAQRAQVYINRPQGGSTTVRGGLIVGGASYGILADDEGTAGEIVIDGVTFDTNTFHHIRIRDETPDTFEFVSVRNCTFLGATPTAFFHTINVLTLSNNYAAQGTPSFTTITTKQAYNNSWDTLTGSIVWNPADLVDGAGETSSAITVTGAALGDYVVFAAPYDLQGITANAYVSATNEVKIRLQNETTGAINLASGTWTVRVMKV